MNPIIGRQIDFALAPEAVRGTPEALAERTVRKVTCNLIPRAERVIDDSTFGRLEDAERVRTVRKWSEGDVAGIAHIDVLGYYYLNLYGDVESTSLGDGVFSHEFSLAQNIAHPTLTLFVKDGEVRQEKIGNGVISNFEITVATDNYVRYTAGFLGIEGATDTSEFPALATEYDFVSRDTVVKIAETEAGLPGADALDPKSLTLTTNPNAEADWVFGSYSPQGIYNKQFAIEGTFTRNFRDNTFKDLYEGDDFRYMEIAIEGEADIGGGEHPTLTVLLNKVQITDWSRESAADDLVVETVSFKAFLNATDEQQSTVTIVNNTESYLPQS
jgi:hypothetical protein